MGKGGTIPRALKSPNNFTITFFNTVHFLPEDLKSERGSAELAPRSGRHLTSLRPRVQAGIFKPKISLLQNNNRFNAT